MKKLNVKLITLLAGTLLASTVSSQTLVPKWSNTTVLGANQQFVDGAGYNPNTGNLIVCEGGSTPTIDRLSTVDGSLIGTMTVTGMTGPTYAGSGLVVDANGIIYACNYGAAGSTKLYSWATETSSPVNFASSTLGAGSVGKTMGMYGTGNNAIFIISTTTTSGIYVYYNGTAWTSKALTVANQSLQGMITVLSWSGTSCAFITKNSSGSGNSNTFNPSAGSPITVTQTAFTTAPMAFVTLSGTATPAQGAGGYDPTTGLFAFHTRALTASPFTISNYLVATGTGTAGLAAPTGCTPVLSQLGVTTSGVDTANYGADFWANKVYYCAPAVNNTGYGLRAFDISAYKITDITPSSQTKNIGDTATFFLYSGGSGTLTYVWKKNSVQIHDTGDYTGTTTSNLLINPVQAGDAGTYTCTVTGAGGINWTTGNGVLNVNLPAPTNTLSLTTGVNPSTYGDSLVFTATIAGGGATPTGTVIFKDGATPLATNTLSGSGSTSTANYTNGNLSATTHSITAVYSGDANYSGDISSPLSQTVNPRSVSVTGGKTYDGTNNVAAASLAVANKVAGDDVTVASGIGTIAGPDAGVQAVASAGTLALGGTTAGNYTLTGLTGSVTVNPLPVTLSGARPYNGAAAAPFGILSIANKIGTDDVSLASGVATLAGATAGLEAVSSVGTLALGGTADGDYTLVGASGSVQVNPLAVVLTGSRTYDGTSNVLAASLIISNSLDGTNVTLNGSATVVDTNSGPQNISVFTNLTLAGTAATNYTLTGASGSVTVIPLPVVLTGTRPYDGTTTAAFGILSIANTVSGDNVALASGTATLAGANVGSENLANVGDLALGGTAATNYTLTGASGSVAITAVPLTITANAQSKTYGTVLTLSPAAFTVGAGLVSPETVTAVAMSASGGTAATDPVSGSPYTITPSAATGTNEFLATNYNITYVTNALTVNPLAVMLTGSRPYDGTTDAAAAILAVSNAISPDVVTVDSGIGSLASSWVGSQAVASAGTLALGGASVGNYTLAGATGLVTITNPHGLFSISSASLDRASTNIVIVWNSIPGAFYQVVASPDMTTWTNVGGPIMATDVLTTNVMPASSFPATSFFDIWY